MIEKILKLLTELSSIKLISKGTGWLAKSSISRLFITRFARIYNIHLPDAEKPIEEYRSLNDFFTRKLKPGARTVCSDESMLASPVDAAITGIGPIKEGQLLDIKGQTYSIAELLNHSPRMVNYQNGQYIVLYLSPTDYHRIHSPVTGKIVETEHIPGRVYPVNDFGLRHMKRVLSRNERLITYVKHRGGEIAIVKVGAMNVSSIQYTVPYSVNLLRGDDLAYFEFGSTVVLCMEDSTFEQDTDLVVGSHVKMGQSLGKLL